MIVLASFLIHVYRQTSRAVKTWFFWGFACITNACGIPCKAASTNLISDIWILGSFKRWSNLNCVGAKAALNLRWEKKGGHYYMSKAVTLAKNGKQNTSSFLLQNPKSCEAIQPKRIQSHPYIYFQTCLYIVYMFIPAQGFKIAIPTPVSSTSTSWRFRP